MSERRPWAHEVVYQVFPDRFHAWHPGHTAWPVPGSFSWNGHPVRHSRAAAALTHRHRHQHTFMGGTLEGLRRRLDHVQQLGATALYLTPIFAARSTHRYDTDDYTRIDPVLGDRAAFERLREDLRARGMQLVLDGVFNHTSFHHAWLTERPEFYMQAPGGGPETWMGTGLLPKLDPEHPELQAALLGVLDHWGQIDAWRLDASHLIARTFLRRLKAHVAGRSLVIGEDWDDARFDLHEGLYDGVTNFAFKRNVEALLTGDCSPETLARRLRVVYEGYPWAAVLQSWNLLGNHDTDRVFSKLGQRDAHLELARVLQLFLPGTPLIYYGDEWGQAGWGDWGARGPMVWRPSTAQRRRRDALAELLALRAAHPALQHGGVRFLHASNRDRVLVWERACAEGRAVVGINMGPRALSWEGEGARLSLPSLGWDLWA
jgi:alpha-glucosidase